MDARRRHKVVTKTRDSLSDPAKRAKVNLRFALKIGVEYSLSLFEGSVPDADAQACSADPHAGLLGCG